MKQLFTTLLLLLFCFTTKAQSSYDQLQPFGFATVSSRTSNVPYNLTGGGAYTYPVTEGDYVVVKASGNDDDTDYNAIRNAINQHAIVILDGSDGPFTITQTMSIDDKNGKTILGINNARLCTKFYITSEIKAALDAAQVGSKSTSSGSGGDLIWKPGTDEEEKIAYVSEERELVTRQVLLALTQDKTEAYRKSGIFKFSTACSNIIIRNIQFEGPGPFDCSGNDLMWLNSSTTHIWVDHCTFIDGMDGNFDISNGSDFITVSWCKFYYTDRAYDHMNTNLVGSSDNNESVDGGKLNVTFAYNHWGTLCRQRMPMTRYGKIHMLNNYYTCTGNTGSCINPRKNSEFLIEGNYFHSSLTNVFGTNSASAWVWSSSYENIIASGASTPSSSGSCSVPYSYSTSLAASNVPTEVGNNAGNTLYDFSKNTITACTVAGNEATIDGTNITYEVPYSYSTTIPVTLTLSDGATADSGTSFNMTLSAEGGAHTSKSIVVTSGNGQSQNTYTLTVTRGEEPASVWGLTQNDLTTSTGITTTTTYTGEKITSFTATSAAMGGSGSTRVLKHGSADAITASATACQRNNLCSGASDFVEDSYYAFTLGVKNGYKLNISGFNADLYYESSRSGKYKFEVFAGSTKVWESSSSDYVTIGGNNNSQKTLDVSSVEALQGLTGTVQIRMVWYQNGSSSYVALKDFNITARVKEDTRTLYDLTTAASPAEGGTITLNPAGGAYEENTEVTMTATANDGYYFVNWTDENGAEVATTKSYVYTMGTEKASFTANFGKYPVITFSKGESGAEGTVPAQTYTSIGSFTIPTNNSLYVAGKTLTAWNDGNADYEIGEDISNITSDITLTPVFTTNNFAVSNLPKTTIDVPFTQNDGAPIMKAEGSGNPTTMRVVQAYIGNKFIDVLLSVDASNGKFNNDQGNPNSCQINATTKLTVPAVNGMKITLNKEFSTSYIGTSTTGSTSDGSTTWTYNGEETTVTLTINESNKYPTLMTLYYPNGSQTITLGKGGYSTFAGEYNYTVSGAKALTAQNKATSVGFTEIQNGTIIPAEAGIVLQGNEGDEVTITYTDDNAGSIGNNDMVGVTANNPFSASDNVYVIATKTAGTKFYKYTGSTFPEGKAYLNATVNAPGSLDIDFGGATAVEAITEVGAKATTPIKVIKEGKLYIGNYNIAGARIK